MDHWRGERYVKTLLGPKVSLVARTRPFGDEHEAGKMSWMPDNPDQPVGD